METRHYSRNSHHDNPRKSSVDSVEGDYDLAGNAYDNIPAAKTVEDGHYDSARPPAYYDNPAVL